MLRARCWMLVAAATVAALFLAAGFCRGRASGNPRNSLTVDGRKRTFELHVPPSYTRGTPAPLVLALHGRLGTGNGMAKLTHFDAVADSNGFLVAYPDGLDRSWADGRGTSPSEKKGVDDVKFLAELIAAISREYSVDPARVYIAGISNGGFMTQRAVCELSDRIAAAVVDAALLGENLAASCRLTRAVPMLFVQGSADPIVPITGGALGKNASHGLVLSYTDTIRKWREWDGCKGAGEVAKLPELVNDGTFIRRETFAGCAQRAEVTAYTVVNGGHAWPGGLAYLPKSIIGITSRNMDASQVAWEFFARHPLP